MKTLQRRQKVKAIARNKGFTLFELVAFILIVAIVFSVAMRRFEEFPGEAERANFLAITTQIRAAVTLQMMNAIATGQWDDTRRLENTNPMNLMLETPTNYAGEFGFIDEIGMPKRSWYFDTYNGHLVYLASDTSHLFSRLGDGTSTLNSVRFRIAARYSDEKPGAEPGLGIDAGTVTGLNDPSLRSAGRAEGPNGAGSGRKWQGLVLEEVTPYRWDRAGLSLPGVEIPE